MKKVNITSRMINPIEMNNMPLRATVVRAENNYLRVKPENPSFSEYEAFGPHDYGLGEIGRVFVGDCFYFESDLEAAAKKKWWEADRKREAEEAAEKQRFYRLKTREHNSSFILPFNWVPSEFIRVRMLHERGTGNGSARNSVGHIVLLEDFNAQRVVRRKGQALCKNVAKFEDDISFHGDKPEFLESQRERVPVSCKACIKIASKFMSPKKNHDISAVENLSKVDPSTLSDEKLRVTLSLLLDHFDLELHESTGYGVHELAIVRKSKRD